MKLFTGGAYQGKLAYLKHNLSISTEDIFFCSSEDIRLDLSKRAVSGLHLWIKAMADQALAPISELLKRRTEWKNTIFLCDEIGMGIVPLGEDNRHWREETGKALSFLSKEADQVLLFIAGLPVILKCNSSLCF